MILTCVNLGSLTEQEPGLVVQTAQFVKMAHSFGYSLPSKVQQTCIDFTRYMYPKLPYHHKTLTANVLEDAEPIRDNQINSGFLNENKLFSRDYIKC